MALFAYEPHIDARVLRARTMLVTLTGFQDAGHAQRGLDEVLTDQLGGHLIGRVDSDRVLDYHQQRPALVFDRDHFTRYEAPEITLHSVTDTAGEPFLLLRGAEPALRWEELAADIEHIVSVHEVETVVVVSSNPMTVPHTRPLLTTRWASDPSLIADQSSVAHKPPVFGTMVLPASFPTMLAYRLGQAGHDVIGLSAHIPHYLSEIPYPDAVLTLLEGVRDVSGLQLPSDEVVAAATVVKGQIAAQVEASRELTEMVSALERQYDEGQRALASRPVDLPSADEIGAEVENFLKGLDTDGGGDSQPK